MKKTLIPAVALFALFAFALIMGPPVEAQGFNPDRPSFHPKAFPSHGHDDDSSDDDSSDDDGECVVLCHKPGTLDEETKCLPQSAVSAHLGHGDHLGECPSPDRETILDVLIRTDGVQALVAAVLVVDESTGAGIAAKLDDPYANWVLFAPSNRAFERLLRLKPGDLDGLSIETIASALPALLNRLEVPPETVRDILLKHLAVNPGSLEDASEDGLLRLGDITVADQSVFPISIGRNSVAINYEGEFTKPDVFTVNGVIHYLDTVIVDAPPPGDTVLVFVTSRRFTGRLFGFVGADAVCDNLAFSAGLGTEIGAWKAWLSTNETDARDRIIDAKYELLDGTVIADSLADLTDGTLDAPINVDENLAPVTENPDVWTGTAFDGTWSTAMSGTCAPDATSDDPWTSEDPTRFGGRGRATEMDAGWTRFGAGGMSCDSENRLYCFSNFAIVDPPDETEVCSQGLCEMDTDLAEQCEDFLTVCLPNEPTEDCIAAALLICRDLF